MNLYASLFNKVSILYCIYLFILQNKLAIGIRAALVGIEAANFIFYMFFSFFFSFFCSSFVSAFLSFPSFASRLR